MGWLDKLKLFGGTAPAVQTDAPAVQAAVPGPLDDFWYTETARAPAAGVPVTADSALKTSPVYCAVRILTDIISTLPLSMYKLRTPGLMEGGMDPAPNHPLQDLITFQPNVRQTASEFWGMMVLHAVLRGSAYAEIVEGKSTGIYRAIDQIIPIPPSRIVNEEILEDGTFRIDVIDPKTRGRRKIHQYDLFRISGLTADGIKSLNTVDLAAESISLFNAAEQYAGRVFSNKLNAGDYITLPENLSKESSKNLAQRLADKLTGAINFHRPLIVPHGAEIKQASMKASDAQLLEARKWQIGEVFRFFGIPLHMGGIDDQTNRSTVEEQSLNFVRFTIRPIAEKIQQAIRRYLVIPPAQRFYVAVFNLDGIESGNMEARSKYFAMALGSGGHPPWLTQDEVRSEEGYNTRGGKADKLAEGTNPSQNQPQPAQNQPQPEPKDERPSNASIEDNSIEARVARLVKIENAALRKNSMRLADDPDGLRTWIKAFYGGHVSKVMEILWIPKEAAQAYCGFQRDEALKANDIVALIDRRDETLAAQIVDTLKRHADEEISNSTGA